MSKLGARILSREAGAFWQFVKYGIIGAMATVVQTAVFYASAATILPFLKSDDWAVRLFSLPAVEATDAVRSLRFALATAIGFVVANIFCWLMNRSFVFRPGRHRWWTEAAMFFAVSAGAVAVATVISALAIRFFGLMTSLAVVIEVGISFFFNYFIRKFVIFNG